MKLPLIGYCESLKNLAEVITWQLWLATYIACTYGERNFCRKMIFPISDSAIRATDNDKNRKNRKNFKQ